MNILDCLYTSTQVEAGVYILKNCVNGKIYVGASDRIQVRVREHVNKLNNFKHLNTELQKDWHEHGAESFSFELLESVPERSTLRLREAFWMEELEERQYKTLYNIMPGCFDPGAKWLKHTEETKAIIGQASTERNCTRLWRVKSPSGDVYEIKNLSQFCEERGLDHRGLFKVARGERRQYKGWTCEYADEKQSTPRPQILKERLSASSSKSYLVTFPDGSTEEIKGLKPFCDRMGLSYKSMQSVAQGISKQWRGWKVEPMELMEVLTGNGVYEVTDPEGKVFVIEGMAKFCRENGLRAGSMFRVATGERRTHKGWKCKRLE